MKDRHFTYDELSAWIGRSNRANARVPCPLCGPQCRTTAAAREAVLSIWQNQSGIIGYLCYRCEVKGGVKFDDKGGTVKPPPRKKLPPPKNYDAVARRLWAESTPLIITPAQLYLMRRRCFIESPNIRFLRGAGKYHHAMIARFSSKDGSTNAVHLTRLNADGTKADVRPVKIMLGRSAGWPIIVNDGGDDKSVLFVAEGIEDAASLHLATGKAAWAAGAAGRIAKCVARARAYETIVVAVDDDRAGNKAFADTLAVRPDALVVKFIIGDEVLDANSTLQRHGLAAVKSCIDKAMEMRRCEAAA